MPIKVVLTDDHMMVLDGLKNVLKGDPDIEVTGVFQSGKELLATFASQLPDVLLLDLQLADITGQEVATKIIKEYPSVKIIILSGIESPPIIQDMMKFGCRGYLLKSTTNKTLLLEAIKKVYEGQLYMEASVQQRLLQDVLDAKQTALPSNKKLTTREKDILRLIAGGYTNQQIGDMLYISPRTVENHRHNLIQKLEVKNSLGLIKAAMDLGLMP